jgi:hypothetical protein
MVVQGLLNELLETSHALHVQDKLVLAVVAEFDVPWDLKSGVLVGVSVVLTLPEVIRL